MLELNFVRNNLDLVQQKVEAKGTPFDQKLFTEIDRKRREQITNIENIKNKKNLLGKEIGMLRKQGTDTREPEEQSKAYSAEIADLEEANMLELNNPEKRNKCKYCVDLIKVKLGSYSKKNLDIDKFKPYIDDAIERAKKLDINPYGKWPSQIGTHVYKLIESIKETKNKLEKRFQ